MTNPTDLPQRTERPEELLDFTGLLIAVDEFVQPVLIHLGGSPDFYLACFETEEKLRDVMTKAGADFAAIKQITDGGEFLSALPSSLNGLPLHVVMNIRDVGNGRIRWMEVQPG